MSGNDGEQMQYNTVFFHSKIWMHHPRSSANELTLKAKDDVSGCLLMGVDVTEFLSDVYNEVHKRKNPRQIPAKRVSLP